MSDTFKQLVGRRGEDEACIFLKKLGFSIIDRNYWRKWGEIDVIAKRGNELRFVEVKTVSRERFSTTGDDYEPEDNIHPWKRKRLRRVIETYLLANDWCEDLDWQVDAISVYLNRAGELLEIEHLEDIAI
jgi:putative endonuclease